MSIRGLNNNLKKYSDHYLPIKSSQVCFADLETWNKNVFHTIYSSSECLKLGFYFYFAYQFFKNLFLTSIFLTISKSGLQVRRVRGCDLHFIKLKSSDNVNSTLIMVYILFLSFNFFALLLFEA